MYSVHMYTYRVKYFFTLIFCGRGLATGVSAAWAWTPRWNENSYPKIRRGKLSAPSPYPVRMMERPRKGESLTHRVQFHGLDELHAGDYLVVCAHGSNNRFQLKCENFPRIQINA